MCPADALLHRSWSARPGVCCRPERPHCPRHRHRSASPAQCGCEGTGRRPAMMINSCATGSRYVRWQMTSLQLVTFAFSACRVRPASPLSAIIFQLGVLPCPFFHSRPPHPRAAFDNGRRADRSTVRACFGVDRAPALAGEYCRQDVSGRLRLWRHLAIRGDAVRYRR